MKDNEYLLKNLGLLIRRATIRYTNEFIWQDVQLTEDFKKAFTDYLSSSRYDVEFFESTAVITSPLEKYIFVPNQWFVIAAYAVDVYEELIKYKNYFRSICDDLGKKTDVFAKALRDNPTITEKTAFFSSAEYILKRKASSKEQLDDACSKLWRFATDYSWWSGQKTIDRGDFFVSVILNMLNLVAASQGYVADIVNAYGTDNVLRVLVKSADRFTVGFNGSSLALEDEENDAETDTPVAPFHQEDISSNEAASSGKIKITHGKLKEIKIKE